MRWLLWCFCLLAESYETINHYLPLPSSMPCTYPYGDRKWNPCSQSNIRRNWHTMAHSTSNEWMNVFCSVGRKKFICIASRPWLAVAATSVFQPRIALTEVVLCRRTMDQHSCEWLNTLHCWPLVGKNPYSGDFSTFVGRRESLQEKSLFCRDS